jgi:hypothetical protein
MIAAHVIRATVWSAVFIGIAPKELGHSIWRCAPYVVVRALLP